MKEELIAVTITVLSLITKVINGKNTTILISLNKLKNRL